MDGQVGCLRPAIYCSLRLSFDKTNMVFERMVPTSRYDTKQSNVVYQNIKTLKRIGNSIEKVSIVNDGNNKYTEIKNGILIEYSQGDSCIKDPSI